MAERTHPATADVRDAHRHAGTLVGGPHPRRRPVRRLARRPHHVSWSCTVNVAGLELLTFGTDADRRDSVVGALTVVEPTREAVATIEVVNWSFTRIAAEGDRHIAEPVRQWVDRAHGLLARWDPQLRTGLWAIAEPFSPHWEVGAPMRPLLSFILEDHGFAMIHASGIVGEKGGVLIGGRSHSGKSTLTWNAVAAGYRSIGDDYCVVAAGIDRVHSVFASIKVAQSERTVNRGVGPALRHTGLDDRERTVHPLLTPEKSMRCRAVLLPEFGPGAGSEAVSAAGKRGMAEIIPTSIFQLPVRKADALSRISSFLRAVPSFSLRLGSDRLAGVHALREFVGNPIDRSTPETP